MNSNPIQKAIELAVKGGYKDKKFLFDFGADFNIRNSTYLDPDFWRALGSELGWEDGVSEAEWKAGKGRQNWKDVWHKFIDHLAAKKSPDSFFKDLLK